MKRNEYRTKLKGVRIASGMTQSELAKETDLNVRVLQHYEQGSKNFDHSRIDTILKICLALKCEFSDIIENEDFIALWNDYHNR